MEFVFCTHNKHKLEEVRQILGNRFDFKTLSDIHFHDEIPEPYDTLEQNSLTKAQTVFDAKNINCFSEDTGLFVEALNGAPGVYSARYAGEQAQAKDNIAKLLLNLSTHAHRKAYFKTVITLIIDGDIHQFAGECHGSISKEIRGSEGFGYDPIFIPEGYELSFAEMDAKDKNNISHRKKAFDKLYEYLQTL